MDEHETALARIVAAGDRTRALTEQLARTADAVAETLERAAEVHDAIAADPNHPLHAEAAVHAAHEREIAAWERGESKRFRRLLDGT